MMMMSQTVQDGDRIASVRNLLETAEYDDDDDDDDDEIAYSTVRWKTRASFVYCTKNIR